MEVWTAVNDEPEVLASDPQTSALELQRLAGAYPSLRPLIAMNPAAYPELLEWLAKKNDPAIKLALQQRLAGENTAALSSGDLQRVSVLRRSGAGEAPKASWVPAKPADDPYFASTPSAAVPASRRPGVIVVWVVAAITLIVAATTLTWMLVSQQNEPVQADMALTQFEQSPAPQSAQSGTEDAAPDEPAAEEPAEVEVKFPAPSSAIATPSIVSPSANITCELGAAGVTCTIFKYSFVDPSLTMCQSQPVSLRTTDQFATVDCTMPPISSSGATTLSYGDYAVSETGACFSAEDGMTCWDTVTGSSFAVARGGFVVGTKGLIPPDQFWWR